MRFPLPLLLAACLAAPEEIDTAADIDVAVFENDPVTGCFLPETEQWPEAFWAEQVQDSCNENDISMYFHRDGSCYYLNGSCNRWKEDPEVTVCVPPNESCCVAEDDCRPG